MGDYTTARAALRKAFDGTQAFYGRYGICSVYDKVARLAFVTGDKERAARLLGYADVAYARDESSRQRREAQFVDDMRVQLQVALGPAQYARESETGHAYTEAQALAEMNAVLNAESALLEENR